MDKNKNSKSSEGTTRQNPTPKNPTHQNPTHQNPSHQNPSPSPETDLLDRLKGSKDFREKGNQHFMEKEYPKAIENYENALKLIPKYHPDSGLCHTNIVTCLEKIEPIDYTSIISKCSLALEAIPKYPKALLKRAKAYEKEDLPGLALQDLDTLILGVESILNDAKEMRRRLDPPRDAGVEDAIEPEANIPSNDDFHSRGLYLCYEALKETLTTEESQPLFDEAALMFQEVVALGLFNWGTVHICAARKCVAIDSYARKEVIEENLKLAKEKYEEAIKIRPDFYDVLLAIGQQQFEMGKLYWSTKKDMSECDSSDMIKLFDSADEKMKNLCEKLEEKEEWADMRTQVNLFWGNVLFERSQIEFNLGFDGWRETMTQAKEKFKLGGAKNKDIMEVMKTHSSLERGE